MIQTSESGSSRLDMICSPLVSPRTPYERHSAMNLNELVRYPRVMNERKTLESLLTGEYQGLARYGDGDIACMRGQPDRYQKSLPELAYQLACGLRQPAPTVLNALIPPPAAGVQGNYRWQCYLESNAGILGLLPDGPYGSASLSRMDSCPYLHTEEWWLEISKLWADKEITLIRGSERSLVADDLLRAPGAPEAVTEIISASRNAYDHYERVLQSTVEAGHQTVILSTGLVARPLVHALVVRGLRAYDLGHIGMWFREGKPIEVLHP